MVPHGKQAENENKTLIVGARKHREYKFEQEIDVWHYSSSSTKILVVFFFKAFIFVRRLLDLSKWAVELWRLQKKKTRLSVWLDARDAATKRLRLGWCLRFGTEWGKT